MTLPVEMNAVNTLMLIVLDIFCCVYVALLFVLMPKSGLSTMKEEKSRHLLNFIFTKKVSEIISKCGNFILNVKGGLGKECRMRQVRKWWVTCVNSLRLYQAQ